METILKQPWKFMQLDAILMESFEEIQCIVRVFLLLTLSMFLVAGL